MKGDGREYVITRANALKLRAEDGRAVSNLDLSLFIHDLPNGRIRTVFPRRMPAEVHHRRQVLWKESKRVQVVS